MLFPAKSVDFRYSTMAISHGSDNKSWIAKYVSGKILTRAVAVWLSAVSRTPRDKTEEERFFDITTSNTDWAAGNTMIVKDGMKKM